MQDSLIWLGNNGRLSTRDLYLKLNQGNQASSIWASIWKLKLPPKVKMFIWKLLNHILTVRVFLRVRLRGIEVSCPICNQREESVEHLFWTCPDIQQIWKDINLWWNLSFYFIPQMNNLVPVLLNKEIKSKHREVWMTVVMLAWWNIWKVRNAIIFQGAKFNQAAVFSKIKYESLSNCINFNMLSSHIARL